MTEYRASFDASVSFSNGGDLAGHGFRVDVPSPDIDEAGIAALFVASLGLLMAETAELRNVTIVAEPHKGTRGGPADRGDSRSSPGGQLVELSHLSMEECPETNQSGLRRQSHRLMREVVPYA